MRTIAGMLLAGVFSVSAAASLFAEQAPAAGQPMDSTAADVPALVEAVWPHGEVREYVFEIAGQPVGHQWNQLTVGPETDQGQASQLNFTLSLDLSAMDQPGKLEMEGHLVLAPQGQPLSYHLDVLFAGQRQQLEVSFARDRVQATVLKDDQESQQLLSLSPNIFVVDNNMIGQWGLLLTLLPLELGRQIHQKIFVPQALAEMDIIVEVVAEGPVEVGGISEMAYLCYLAPIDEICWVTRTGCLVQLEDEKQGLVVTLVPPEGGEVPGEEAAGTKIEE